MKPNCIEYRILSSGHSALPARCETPPRQRRHYPLLVILTMIASSVSLQANSLNLLADGSFEKPTVGPGGPDSGYANFSSGTQIADAWNVVGNGAVSLFTNTETLYGYIMYNVPEGTQALDLTSDMDDGAHVGVQQTIKTTPGMTYFLSFDVGSTLGQLSAVNVLLNGSNVFAATNSTEMQDATDWKPFTYSFRAASASTTLAIYNASAPGVKTNGVDDVRLTASTPEPATLALVGISLLGLGVCRWRLLCGWRRKSRSRAVLLPVL